MQTPPHNLLNSSSNNQKRLDYLSWDEFFMSTTLLTATKCIKSTNRQLAAILVNDRKIIIGTGYEKCTNDNTIHAELDAVRNVFNYNSNNCILYTISFPCKDCAVELVKNGIVEIVYLTDNNQEEDGTEVSRSIFDGFDLKYRQFIPKRKKIEINFMTISNNELPLTP